MNRHHFPQIATTVLLALSIPAIANAYSKQQSKENPAQQQDQSVKLKTNLIQLRAVVSDKKGQLIDNLKKEDFEVLDNGSPQDISFFSIERITSGGGRQPINPGAVPSNPGTAGTPGRILVLFVDSLHMSIFSLARAKQQLKQFVDKEVTDRDAVAVVSTATSLGALQQFMKDKKMLKYAIDKISLRPPDNTSFTPYLAAQVLAGDTSAINLSITILRAEEGYVPFNQTSAMAYVEGRARQIIDYETNLRRATMGTLEGVANQMSDMPGQRMIAFISDGFTLFDDAGHVDNSDVDKITTRAARSGVVIYSFYGKGLEGPAEFSAANRMPPSIDFSRYMSESVMDDQGTLRTLAGETGGETYVNNDIGIALKKMVDNNSIYYSLAYYEPDDKNSKKVRKVSIRIKGHPELEVRSQKRYLPGEENKEEAAVTPQQKLFRDMISPLPVTSIGVTSECDFVEVSADDAQATLLIHINGSSLSYKQEGNTYAFECEVAYAIINSSGKVESSSAKTVGSNLTATQVRLAKEHGYSDTERLTLKPGLYQVRVGVQDTQTGLNGTSMSWVNVPNLHNGKLALSSIILTKDNPGPSRRGAPAKSAQGSQLSAGNAVFKSGELAGYRFIVYNAANGETKTDSGSSDTGPALRVEILQGEKSIYSKSEPLSSRTVNTDAKGIEAGGNLKLGLDPGVYTLRIGVKDSKTKRAVEQTVDFEIEP